MSRKRFRLTERGIILGTAVFILGLTGSAIYEIVRAA